MSYLTYRCRFHEPSESEFPLPTLPPYTGRKDGRRDHQNWCKQQELIKGLDVSIRKFCCARAGLEVVLNPSSSPNKIDSSWNMKMVCDQISTYQNQMNDYRERIKMAELKAIKPSLYHKVLSPSAFLDRLARKAKRERFSPSRRLPGQYDCIGAARRENAWYLDVCNGYMRTCGARARCRLPFRPVKQQRRRRRSHKTRRRVMVLPGRINGAQVAALPDTGAGSNMMSERYARSHNIKIHRGSSNQRTHRLANGRSVRSRGKAYANWSFEKEEGREYELEFEILQDCVYDVIIGEDFLMDTDTMELNRHRVQIQMSTPRDVRYVNLCGAPSQSLLGLIDGEAIAALPDTGSEVNVMSAAYAERRGYKIIGSDDDEMDDLQFADGTSQRPLGKVTAKWAFNDDPGGSIEVTFEVLAQCPYEVIIGMDILLEHDVYNKHKACLTERSTETEKAVPLNYVGWRASFTERLKRKKTTPTTVTQTQVELRRIDDELIRRADAVRQIERIEDSSRRKEEHQKEESRRRFWDENLNRRAIV